MNLGECAVVALDKLDAGIRERFASAPRQVLEDELGFTVREAFHLTTRLKGASCDGASFLEDHVILYAPTGNSKRENFTLAHELGHSLVAESEEAVDWIGDQPDSDITREAVCDAIAQQLLLSDIAVSRLVSGGPVRARHVLDLSEASQASRPVCAIALAKRLPGLGAVVMIDRVSGKVTVASVSPDPEHGWPAVYPWPGQDVPPGHPFGVTRPSAMTRKSFWRMPWGSSADYYIDTIVEGPRIIAVFSDTDVWGAERLHIDRPREFDSRPDLIVHCCGVSVSTRGYPCSTCNQPYCPTCGRCKCEHQAAREVPCRGTCFMQFPSHLLVDGLCEECRP
ncbi:ImmA/IrrE family metallo-endopeptidase [Kribbella swartbergensis]